MICVFILAEVLKKATTKDKSVISKLKKLLV